MSTSILYHGFGIRGYRYVRSEYQQGTIVFTVEKDRSALRCPCCNGRDVTRRGALRRYFHVLPIGKKRVYIKLYVPRVFCRLCKIIRQITIGFAETRLTYTKSFARYAISRHMTIQDVAVHLGISWDIIKDIQRQYLHKHYSQPALKQLNIPDDPGQ